MADTSSDVEYPDPDGEEPPHPYTYGSAAIKLMLANKDHLRRESELASKQLTNDHVGAPQTRSGRQRALAMFLAFYTGVLEKSEESCPTGEDLERFLYSLPLLLKGRGLNGTPTSFHVNRILKDAMTELEFKYSEFQRTEHQKRRFEAIFAHLLKDRLVNKAPVVERLWVGTFAVRRLVQALIKNGLLKGTRSWDVLLFRVLSILLTSALFARDGDITRSSMYHENECVCYKHVQIRVVDLEDGSISFKGLISMFFRKGHKNDPGSAMTVVLNSLDNPAHNIMCPIKFILILALRLGAVGATTIEGVIEAAKARQDREIQWSSDFRERPLLPKITFNGINVNVDVPAAHQLEHTLKLASDLAGMKKQAKPHDLRRGSVRDALEIANAKGQDMSYASQLLGHSDQERHSGVTARYVGHLRYDTWAARVDKFTKDDASDAFEIEFGSRPVQKRRFSAFEVTHYCQKNGIDPSNSNARSAARRKMAQEVRAEWVKSEEFVKIDQSQGADSVLLPPSDASDHPADDTSIIKPHVVQNKKRSHDLMSIHREQTKDGDLVRENRRQNGIVDKLRRSNQTHKDSVPDNTSEDDQDDQDDHDYQASFGSEATGTEGEEAYDDDTVDDSIDERQGAEDDPTHVNDDDGTLSKLVTAPLHFIELFSKINEYRHESSMSDINARGGSRNTPSVFTRDCKNHCGFAHAREEYVLLHELNCTRPRASFATAPAVTEKLFKCDKCTKTYKTRPGLVTHHRRIHNWTPKHCTKGCNSTTLFATYKSWADHLRDFHSYYTARPCPLADICHNTGVWKQHLSLRNHLGTVHRLKSSAITEMLGGRVYGEGN